MKIIFFGTPDFSTPFLQALFDDQEVDVVAVVTQPDKPSGRGGRVLPTPVKQLAQDAHTAVYQPESLKTDATIQDTLRGLGADLFVVVAYGKIIPQTILEIPSRGSINVHPSLLPKYRGPSPMQWAIKEGDAQTGVSIMLLDAGMDTGPILACETITLDADETYETLVQKVHTTGPRLLVETLKRYMANAIIPVVQDNAHATLTRLLEKEDGHINWSKSLAHIERLHRAYSAWPGTWTTWARTDATTFRLKLITLKPTDFNADLNPGTVLTKEGRLFIDCADGTLEILEIQPEGKPKMTATAFIQGYAEIDGAILV